MGKWCKTLPLQPFLDFPAESVQFLTSENVFSTTSVRRLLILNLVVLKALNHLRVSKHIRPQSKRAIGFCWVLVVPGDPMSSCSPSSLSPLSFPMFLSVCLSFYGHQGCIYGQLVVVLLVACAGHQSIPISVAGLSVNLVVRLGLKRSRRSLMLRKDFRISSFIFHHNRWNSSLRGLCRSCGTNKAHNRINTLFVKGVDLL